MLYSLLIIFNARSSKINKDYYSFLFFFNFKFEEQVINAKLSFDINYKACVFFLSSHFVFSRFFRGTKQDFVWHFTFLSSLHSSQPKNFQFSSIMSSMASF
jgi:hypothetical protein